MSTHTTEEIVSIARDMRAGDDILTETRHGVEWVRVTYVSHRDGTTRYVTPAGRIIRADYTRAVFLRRVTR